MYYMVMILQLKEGKVLKKSAYWAAPTEAPSSAARSSSRSLPEAPEGPRPYLAPLLSR